MEDLLTLGHNAVTWHGSRRGRADLSGRGGKVCPLLRGGGGEQENKGQYTAEVTRFTRGRCNEWLRNVHPHTKRVTTLVSYMTASK